jgi:2',3'-cyclic-nucleotide 2'-phosphodiesterase (5'-nucleotidase family)
MMIVSVFNLPLMKVNADTGSQTSPAVVAAWNITSSQASTTVAATTYAPNTVTALTYSDRTAIGSTPVNFAYVASTTNALSLNCWAVGSYWQAQFSTLGYQNINLNFKARSSNTGPRDFKLQYSTDGKTFSDVSNGSYSTSATLSDVCSTGSTTTGFTLSQAVYNAPTVYIRFVVASNIDVRAGTGTYSAADAIQPGGNSNINNIVILGTPTPTGTIQPGTPYKAEGSYDVTVPHIIINQFYGGGAKADSTTPVSNSFAELYNPTNADVNLNGWSLQYATNGTDVKDKSTNGVWQKLDLTGTIKAHCSYLIRMKATTAGASTLRLDLTNVQADQAWDIYVHNKGVAFALMSNNTLLTNGQNPFTANSGKPAAGYVDMLAEGGNDKGTNDFIFANEGGVTGSQSKQKAIRRVSFQDTDHNTTVDDSAFGVQADTQIIGYNVGSAADPLLAWARPRCGADGSWSASPQPAPLQTTALSTYMSLNNTFGSDPCTTRIITWQMPASVNAGEINYSTNSSLSSFNKVSAVTTSNGDNTIKTFRANITGLSAGTKYYYRVVSDSTVSPDVYSFVTGNDTSDSFKFIHVSDTQGTNEDQYKSYWGPAVSAVTAQNPDAAFFLETGDLIDTANSEDQWRWFFKYGSSVFNNYAFLPVIGNHEQSVNYPATAFTQHLSVPNAAVDSNITPGTVYSFDYGNTHFSILNSECLNTPAQVAAQRAWLDNDLKNTNKKWKIVALHRGLYGAGGTSDTFTAFGDLMDKYNVDLILQGHDHSYIRTYKMKNGAVSTDDTGTISLESGGSGFKQDESPAKLGYMEVVTKPNNPTYSVITVSKNNISVKTEYFDINTTNDRQLHPLTANGSSADFSIDKTVISTPRTITILHTNDMHGSLISSSSAIGADMVAAVKNATPNSLLVDAGDATQGNSFATLSKGQSVIDLMNMAGYDVMAAGNHEFDYGLDQFLSNAQRANFPILSANTVKNGAPVLQGVKYNNGTQTNNGCTVIKQVYGINVGFFGITTPETATKTNPAAIPGVTFGNTVDDMANVCKAQIQALKNQGADVIVGLMHIGVDPSSDVTSEKLAAQLGNTGLNIIIDGHSHTQYEKLVNGIYIAQTGSSSVALGKLAVTVDANNSVTVNGVLLKPADLKLGYTPVAPITQAASQMAAAEQPLLTPVVGNTASSLWGGTINGINECRLSEMNLGDMVADSMADAAKSLIKGTAYEGTPVVALQNGGGVRTVVDPGNITRGNVLSVLPFGNSLAFKEVTPAILYKALENGVSKITAQDAQTGKITGADGRFPQISGMRFEYDPTKTASTQDATGTTLTVGNRVTKIVLLNPDGTDKQVLDRNDNTTKIVLASNDFEIAGGDGYDMLKGLKSVGEGGVLDQVFSDYITKLTASSGGTINYPMTQGRIKTVGAYAPKAYSAVITVKDSNATLTQGKEIVYSVDGGQGICTVLDANSKLVVNNLSDGPHAIRIEGAKDILVNNYSGAGTTAAVTGTVAPSGFVLSGDVNCDNVIDIKDALLVLQQANGRNTITTVRGKAAADMDNDLQITVGDVTAVLKKVVGGN